jgi:hypothetical protein
MIVVPSPIDQYSLSDWAELSCIFDNKATLSKAEIIRTLEDAEVNEAEDETSNIWLEIDRRSHLLLSKYPIDVQEGRLKKKNPAKILLEYTFPLLLSSNPWYATIKRGEWTTAAKLFEEYSMLALCNYLKGSAINIGWPRRNGLPRSFKKSIDFVCTRIGEDKGPCDLIKNNSKDEGTDIIAWLPFPDNRPNQAIILAQCAAGKDFGEKIHEPSINLWNNFINWQIPARPAFAFPFVCNDSSEWKRLSLANGGILFDRIRLASLCTFGENNSIEGKLSDWVQMQASRLPRIDS